MPKKQTLNIGLVAHVDAGKTTLTEMLLYNAGVIPKPGSVDKGTSQTDTLEVEKLRGISIRSASATLNWKNITINLIDTPGHADFSSEVERALPALDCAIILISAFEGVQAHTENIWNVLSKLKIPVIIFINKIDRPGCDTNVIIEQIKKYLAKNIFIYQSVENTGTDYPTINNYFFNKLSSEHFESIIDTITNNDDSLLENYLNGKQISIPEILESLKHQVNTNKLYPVLFGSSKLNIGVVDLLDTITDVIQPPDINPNTDVSGIIYKIEHDKTLGRIASVRLFEGTLLSRDEIIIGDNEEKIKITQIRKTQGQKFIQVNKISAGEIGQITGLNVGVAGDNIGLKKHKAAKLHTPLLSIKITPENNNDYTDLVFAMQQLSIEDPTLNLNWLKDERELQIKIMGIIQIQILKTLLLDRFGIKTEFSEPTVIYKETPSGKGIAFEEYTMPKPCWAIVKFLIEPGERDSGIIFNSQVDVNKIAQRYQNEIERTIPKSLEQGILGWEVTDIKITLTDGEDHNIHSRAGDFAIATPMALMKAFRDIGTTLLEPVYKFSISAPEIYLGKIANSLSTLRTEIGIPVIENGIFTLSGIIPVKESLDYATKLASLTKGKAKYKTRFNGYRECSLEDGRTTPYRGINPLDRSKFILKARKALL